MKQDTHIIVASVHERAFSETFIHNHIEHLPYTVSHAWGAYLGYALNDDHLLPPFVARIPKVGDKLLLEKWANIIHLQNIKLVLAEYGPVAVHWLPVCQRAKIPLLVYFHGFDATRYNIIDEYRLKYRELFEYASCIFVVSQPMAKQLVNLGAPAEKLVLNPCGADLSMFRDRGQTRQANTVLSVGRFTETKRPDLTIQAFSQVLEKIPTATLHMVGDGDLQDDCIRLSRQLGIGERVKFLDVLPPAKVAEEMQQASVFVQHSMTTPDGETEGAPVAIMEAGASGLPVVSTRHAGIPEIVEHKETGYLVAEGDTEAMAAYIIKLLQDKPLAQQMGKAAAERVAQQFSLKKNLELLEQNIDKYL